MLFLDIEGYVGLSEQLDRATLNALVERYFSRFLTPIRAEGGEVNEIAGDGLMIIFQAGEPAEHAGAAVRAALAIRAETELGNREARAFAAPPASDGRSRPPVPSPTSRPASVTAPTVARSCWMPPPPSAPATASRSGASAASP